MRSRRIWITVALSTCAALLAACGGSAGSGKGATSGVPLDLGSTGSNGVVISVLPTAAHASTHAASTSAKPTKSSAVSTHASTHAAATTSHPATHTSVVAAACTHNPDTYTGSQHITVTPYTCVRDGQTVSITASGFKRNESVVVVECADKGDATGANDCTSPQAMKTDATGTVHTSLTVHKGPFGGNKIVCSASTPCLVSVTEAKLLPPRLEADRRITFA